MSIRHPSETDLALLAGGDCGWLRRVLLNRHVAGCGDCKDTLSSFGELRSAMRESATLGPDGPDWDRLADEMRANIRVGLAAGECVREVPAGRSHIFGGRAGWKPQFAIGAVCVLLLAGAGAFLRGLLPHDQTPAAVHSAVLESTGAGIEVRTDSGSMTLLNRGDAEADETVTSDGAIRARYVDGNTGMVTVTSVYAQ